MKRKIFVFILSLVMALCFCVQIAFAEPEGVSADGQEPAERTILLYCCGADLESAGGMAAFNLEQILKSSFSRDDDINVIVMTGGSKMWQLDDDDEFGNPNKYLAFPDGVNVPDDAVNVVVPGTGIVYPVENVNSAISGVYNQVWEARGKDAVDENGDPDPNAGKLVCLDGDGLTGEPGKALKNEDELMTDPATLKAFINYGVENYPAEKYDLIFWDHGGGPQGGYGHDENYNKKKNYPEGVSSNMSFAGIVDALSHNKVVDSDGDGVQDSKFDFVDFDACLMGNLELSFVLSDYTKYYIASAETEPGFGQYYGPRDGKQKGWLDQLGDPDMDTIYNADNGSFALGKIIVDDMYEFYSKEEGKGSGDHSTLAVFDTEAMVNNAELIGALGELSGKLKAGAEGTEGNPLTFYNELRSFFNSINYSECQLFDIADAAALLGVNDPAGSDQGDAIDYTNEYSGLAETFAGLFPRGETENIVANDFMYAKCTLNEKTEDAYYYDKNAEDNPRYGTLFSTGLTIFFPDTTRPAGPVNYYKAMDPVLEAMPVKDDGRYEFLKGYEEVVADYATILFTGASIGRILNNEYAFFPDNNPYLDDTSNLDYEAVLRYWKNEDNNVWDQFVTKNLSKRSAGVDGSLPWLEDLIDKMVVDAMFTSGVDATEIEYERGTGYRVEVKQGNNTIFKSVEQNIVAELPALNSYLDSLTPKAKRRAMMYSDFAMGSIKGVNIEGNIWELQPFDEKWYAINDADGNNHVASIYGIDKNKIGVPALYGSSEDGDEEERLIMLEFAEEADDSGRHELKSVCFVNADSGPIHLDPASLTGEYTLTPILYVTPAAGSRQFYMPISKSTFVINKDNADNIALDKTDIDEIPDIEDTNNDGKKINSTLTVTDLYGGTMNITGRIVGSLKHISMADIKPATYTGKELTPKVTCKDKTLVEGIDYTWEKVPDVTGEGEDEEYSTPEFIKVRSYEVLLKGKGEYTGFANIPFVIKQATNPLNVKGKTIKKSYGSTKKKSITISASKVLNYSGKGQGKVTFAKLSTGERFKKIAVNKSKGTITLKKGLTAGTYNLKVRVNAAGNTNYKSGSKNATIKIIVLKAANSLNVKGKTIKEKYKKLKKKSMTLSAAKVLKYSSKGQGKRTFSKASTGKKYKKITVNKKTGKITLKKGLKKGTYKLKVKVKAAGNSNYKAGSRTVTITIKIK